MNGPPGPDGGTQPAASAPAKVIVATDGSVAAERIDHLDYHQARPRGVSWPVLVGQIPAAASVFQDRLVLRAQVDAARPAGCSVVLSGGGGVGKSQLAASYADQAILARDGPGGLGDAGTRRRSARTPGPRPGCRRRG